MQKQIHLVRNQNFKEIKRLQKLYLDKIVIKKIKYNYLQLVTTSEVLKLD